MRGMLGAVTAVASLTLGVCLYRRPGTALGQVRPKKPARGRRRVAVPAYMLEHIIEKAEAGKTPKEGWFRWLQRRYTDEAVRDFLDEWHHATCNYEMVQRVQNALGMKKLPEHIQTFGRFMMWKSGKTVKPEDVVKAHAITLSSIQRGEIDAEKLPSRARCARRTPSRTFSMRLPKGGSSYRRRRAESSTAQPRGYSSRGSAPSRCQISSIASCRRRRS